MSSEFGTYRLSYAPGLCYDTAYVEPSVDMSISGEADLSQMLSFFECFLKASGYEFEGKELCLERTAPDFSFSDAYSYGSSYFGPFGGGASSTGTEGVQATGSNQYEK